MVKETEMLDIGNFDTTAAGNKGAEIQLLNPVSGAKLPFFITVYGKDSDAFREHQRETVNARIRREAAATKRGKDADIRTAEEMEEEACELLTVCTISWRTEIINPETKEKASVLTLPYHGEALAFNAKNVMTIYRNQLWIRRQIDAAIGDIENFM